MAQRQHLPAKHDQGHQFQRRDVNNADLLKESKPASSVHGRDNKIQQFEAYHLSPVPPLLLFMLSSITH